MYNLYYYNKCIKLPTILYNHHHNNNNHSYLSIENSETETYKTGI